MSKKSFVIFWPVLLFLGLIGTFEIFIWFFGGELSDIPRAYGIHFFSGPNVSYPFTIFAFSMLIISLILWFKRPNIWTLLGTIITAWGLCGIPAMYIIAMSNFRQ